jgi:hypothetical protein
MNGLTRASIFNLPGYIKDHPFSGGEGVIRKNDPGVKKFLVISLEPFFLLRFLHRVNTRCRLNILLLFE